MTSDRPPVDDQQAAHEWLMAKYEEAQRQRERARAAAARWPYFFGGHRNYEGER